MKCKLNSFIMLCVLLVASLANAAALSITTAAVPAATASTAYTATMTASGGAPPYTWRASAVPAGLSLSQNGVLSGTPTIPGSYTLQLNVTDSNRSLVYRCFSLMVAKAPPSNVTLAASLPSPQRIGAVATFTAQVTSGQEPYEYQFLYKDPVTSTLRTVQAYSSANSWTMNTQLLKPNTYPVTVYARKVGSTANYEASYTLSYTILPPSPATGLAIASTLPSPQEAGKHITITASLENTDAAAKFYYYQFTLTSPDGSIKKVVPFSGDYTTANNWMWNTFGSTPGIYTITVYAKQYYATTYETVASINYTLDPPAVTLPNTDPYKNGQVYIEKNAAGAPGYYVAGSTYVAEIGINPADGYGAFAAKYDADWKLLWKRFAMPYNGGWVVNSKLDKTGNLAIVGYAAKTFFRKYDPAGDLIASWDAPTLGATPVVAFDDDNNAYLAWEYYKSGGGSTIYLTKIGADGSESWTWQASPSLVVPPTVMNNGPRASLTGIAVGADGNIHLSGKTLSSSGIAESNVTFVGVTGGFFLTLDPLGNLLSNIPVANTGGGPLFTDSQGNFVTIGAEAAAPGTPAAWDQTKFDVNGSLIWQNALFSTPANSLVRDMTQDEQGNFYVLTQRPLDSTTPLVSNQYDGIVITKIDTEGNKLWTAVGGVTEAEPTTPLKISVDATGNCYVQTTTTLPVTTNGSYNYPALVMFDANGKQVWMK